MKVSHIITESGMRLEFDDVKKLLETDYSDAYAAAKNGNFIYRGFGDSHVVFELYKPLKDRTSKNTNNFYTLIMNNDPRFSKLPNRAVIASTSKQYAFTYASSELNVAVLFPKNGTTLAISPSHDIWTAPVPSAKNSSFGYYEWGRLLERILSVIVYPSDIRSYQDMLNADKVFKEYIKDEEKKDLLEADLQYLVGTRYNLPDTDSFIENIFSKGLVYYYELLDPSVFETVSISNYPSLDGRHEIWFDNEFIAINIELIDSLL